MYSGKSGNIGIGTNVPGAKLNVRGPDNNTLLKLERNSVSGSGLDITYRGANDGYEIKSNDQGGISLEASGNHELRFETNGQKECILRVMVIFQLVILVPPLLLQWIYRVH